MIDPMVEQAIDKLGSVPEAAKRLSVSKSLLYMVKRGERTASKRLLDKLGLTRVQLITRAQ